MKKTFLVLAITLFATVYGFAQKPSDPELNQLIDVAASLRQNKASAWDNALKTMSQDKKWTMMDEIERDENECWLVGDKQFKLNPILNKCSGHDSKMVSGDFLNGNDPNFDYSITERGIKKGSQVRYALSYREGRQTFVIMPYDVSEAKNLDLEVLLNGQSMGHGSVYDGNLYLNINQAVKLSDTILLVITNKSQKDMPVVIINHNTRKQ